MKKILLSSVLLLGILSTGCSEHLDPENINHKNQDFSVIVYVDKKATEDEAKRISSLVSNIAGSYQVGGVSFQKKISNGSRIFRANCKVNDNNDEQSALNYLTSMLKSDGLSKLVDVVVISNHRE